MLQCFNATSYVSGKCICMLFPTFYFSFFFGTLGSFECMGSFFIDAKSFTTTSQKKRERERENKGNESQKALNVSLICTYMANKNAVNAVTVAAPINLFMWWCAMQNSSRFKFKYLCMCNVFQNPIFLQKH